MNQLRIVGALLLALSFTACEKEDTPVVLPQKGDTEHGIVEMGEDYKFQVFFDLQSGQVVHSSEINSWHLAFDCSADGFQVFMNGGADVFVDNTHETNFASVKTSIDEYSNEWQFDRPCGLADSAAIQDWRDKNEVYVVRLNPTYTTDNIKKVKLVSVTDKAYVIEYGSIEDETPKTISIPKDDSYNYSYFSFDNGGQVVQPDPPKDTWDVVFTRYRFIYYDLDNFPYIVNGVLLNPYKTQGYAHDSTQTIETVNEADVPALPYTNHRDVIGFSWKEYDFDEGRYKIAKDNEYYIHTRNNNYWKLRFLDFYNAQNIKGSPSFEYVRIF